MTAAIDLTGKRFHHLTVVREAPKTYDRMWRVVCKCGKKKVVAGTNLRAGTTKSCGCHRNKVTKAAATARRQPMVKERPREYSVWRNMYSRCYRSNIRGYEHYGGRGIKMCPRWKKSFAAFYEDMGPRPSVRYEIDRIDNNKGYSKGNCRWVTKTTNVRNRRNTIYLTFQRVRLPAAEWAERVGISFEVLRHRLAMGWTTRRALTQPVRRRTK